MRANAIVKRLGEMLTGGERTSQQERNDKGAKRDELAMLIDVENASPTHMDEVMRVAARYGEVTHRLAFGAITGGKWTKSRLSHAIRWGTQSHVKTAKNCADIELTIAAMDLLHDPDIAGYCIVSSDSDFTPLVMRLREAGKLVIGFGESKVPAAFVEACDHFETIAPGKGKAGAGAKAETKPAAGPKGKAKIGSHTEGKATAGGSHTSCPSNDGTRREFLNLVKKAANGHGDGDGWIWTAMLGEGLRKLKPKIRYRDYGHRTLIGVLKTFPDDVETRRQNNADQMRMKA